MTIASGPPQPTTFNVGGSGPGLIRDLLGANSLPSTQVGSDPDLGFIRANSPIHQRIADYLGQRIAQGRDLDPNSNVEKRYPSGTSLEINGQETPVVDTNALRDVAYHDFGGNVSRARDYVGTNELADAAAKRALPNATAPEIETIGQSVSAQVDKAVSFSQIMNWQADASDMSRDPAANLGPQVGNLGDRLASNYSNLFAQNDRAINSVLQSNNIDATAADFNREFEAYRNDPSNSNVPRSQLMQNFTNQFVQNHAAPGTNPNGAAILDQMQTQSQQNLQQSAEDIVQRRGGNQSSADPSTLLGSSSYAPGNLN